MRVDQYFERCHGLILLISSRLFDDEASLPSENPFPRSVGYLIEDCRQRKRPLAIVLSQADADSGLGEEEILRFPRIRRFRRHFTSDLREALAGERPFGIVKLLTCYERLNAAARQRRRLAGRRWRLTVLAVVAAALLSAFGYFGLQWHQQRETLRQAAEVREVTTRLRPTWAWSSVDRRIHRAGGPSRSSWHGAPSRLDPST